MCGEQSAMLTELWVLTKAVVSRVDHADKILRSKVSLYTEILQAVQTTPHLNS